MICSRLPAVTAIRSAHARRSDNAVPASRSVPLKTCNRLTSGFFRRNAHHFRKNGIIHRFPHSVAPRHDFSGNSFSKLFLTFSAMLPQASNSSGSGSRAAVDRVAIVGGGLGGLAAAIALRKQGIDAQVHPDVPQSMRFTRPSRTPLLAWDGLTSRSLCGFHVLTGTSYPFQSPG